MVDDRRYPCPGGDLGGEVLKEAVRMGDRGVVWNTLPVMSRIAYGLRPAHSA